MSAELFDFLARSSVAVTAIIAGLLVLRVIVLRLFGPRCALWLWLSVPAALLALLLPPPTVTVPTTEPSVWHTSTSTKALPSGVSPVSVKPATLSASVDASTLQAVSLLTWALGCLLMAVWFGISQWQLRRRLGPLVPESTGIYRSRQDHFSPMTIGLARPCIVLPSDFRQRFSPREQELILANERCHQRRGDVQLCLLATLIRCLYWFHPLVHLAWRRFRADQEYACDAVVLREHPTSRRVYAEAMISAQSSAPIPPVACSWQTGDSLKGRITMLYTTPTRPLRLIAGAALAVVASTAGAVGVWKTQPPVLVLEPAPAPTALATAEAIGTTTPPAAAQPTESPADTPNAFPQNPVVAGASLDYSIERTADQATPMHAPGPAATITEPAVTVSTNPTPPTAAPQKRPSNRSSAPTLPPAAEKPQTSGALAETRKASFQPARLVFADQPDFPTSRSKPQLVQYTGMAAAELPGPEWQPEKGLWHLQVAVEVDASGEVIDANIASNPLRSAGMVRRYEQFALHSAKNWEYAPAVVDDEKVASQVELDFYFDTGLVQPLALTDVGRGVTGLPRGSIHPTPGRKRSSK